MSPVEKIRHPTLRRLAYGLRAWCLTLGPPLLAASIFSIFLGAQYLLNPKVWHIHPLEALLPDWVVSTMWLGIGAGMGVLAFVPRFPTRIASVIFGAWAMLMILWGVSWLALSLDGTVPRGSSIALLYLGPPIFLAWVAWRGARISISISMEGGGYEPSDSAARDVD
ncbi:hypothetical protein [Corynebacterium cystitidis]|uniref:hypothetical protein n=1 Tax=Corynebacterium cystitidis TaxID=35757 RepID=UPI00211DEDBE|nr:hypothetical protein [Corynebacterium cystitidis]